LVASRRFATIPTVALPLKTTEEDLEKVTGYLKNQVGWVPLTQVRRTIPSKHADNRKIEAMRSLVQIQSPRFLTATAKDRETLLSRRVFGSLSYEQPRTSPRTDFVATSRIGSSW
jgi:hypothetical protein